MVGLRLPLPVQATTVEAVVTQAGLPVPVPLFRFYAVGSNPIAELPPSQTLQVTGQSPNWRWWRHARSLAVAASVELVAVTA